MIKETDASFLVENSYTDENGIKKTVRVCLEIKYNIKKYSITPAFHAEKFTFISSRNPLLWKTVIGCIDEAIDFAEDELNQIKP